MTSEREDVGGFNLEEKTQDWHVIAGDNGKLRQGSTGSLRVVRDTSTPR